MRAPIILLTVGVGLLIGAAFGSEELIAGFLLVGVVCVLVACGWLASEWYRRRKP